MADNNDWNNLNDDFGSDWNLDLDFDGIDSASVDDIPVADPARPAKKIAKTAGEEFDKLDIPMPEERRPASDRTSEKPAAKRPVQETAADRGQKAQPAVSQIRARHAESGAASGSKSAKKPARKSAKKRGGINPLLLIIVILAVILVIFAAIKLLGRGGEKKPSGESTENSTEETGTAASSENDVTWLQNSNQDILSLVNRYYAALTQVDMTTLEQILDPGVTVSQSKVESEAAVIEGYQDICCYITDGMQDGEWAIYVSFAMKFKNISTPAPGLVPGYVVTDTDGNLRLIPWANIEEGGEIFDYMSKVADCDAIDQLAASVVAAYKEAKESDETLKTFLNALSGETEADEDNTEAESSGSDDETTASVESASGQTDEDGFTAADDTMYVTTNVKCRYMPNTNDDTEFKLVDQGTKVQITGIGSGDWNKVCLPDGTKGYIMKKYLTHDAP